MAKAAAALAILFILLAATAEAAGSKNCANVSRKEIAGGGTEYTLYSHEDYEIGSLSRYANNASCTWPIRAPPAGTAWRIVFQEVDLESSVTTSQCKYDNLTVVYKLNLQVKTAVLCGKHRNLLLVTNGSFEIRFRSDSSVSQRGFKVTWSAMAAGQISQISPMFLDQDNPGSCDHLKSSGPIRSFGGRNYSLTRIQMLSDFSGGRNYLHGADCTWTIQPANGSAVYLTFETVQLEPSPTCNMDSLTVTYRQFRRGVSQRRIMCNIPGPQRLVSAGLVTLQLKTDSTVGGRGFSLNWFVAPLTGQAAMFESSLEFRDATQCPEVEQLDSRKGRIRLYYEPPQTYEPQTRCSWIVSVPSGKVAKFYFTRFQLSSYPSWRRYNYTGMNRYCSYRDDSVRILYSPEDSSFYGQQSKTFCSYSEIRLGEQQLSAVGRVSVSFSSFGYRSSQGFVLEFTFEDKAPIRPIPCPPVRQLNKWRRQIANLTSSQPSVTANAACSWYLQPASSNYQISLMITLNPRTLGPSYMYQPSYHRPIFEPSSPRFYGCDPRVLVSSQNFVSSNAIPAVDDPTRQLQAMPSEFFYREYCRRAAAEQVGLFDGPVNVSISSMQSNLDLRGFSVLITEIPKPQRGCSNMSVTTEHYQSRIVKVFRISGKAGCITSESLSSFSSIYSRTVVKVTFQLNCTKAKSTESLDVLSETLAKTVKCGSTVTVYDSWKSSLILAFPADTDATVISSVFYNFPVSEAFCRRLNEKTSGNGTIGSYLLPLMVGTYGMAFPVIHGLAEQISCSYRLAYRPGYSIRLHVSHNLGHRELDFYCLAKTVDKRINPHIVLTVLERDPDYPGAWVERQLDMCHGYSVGSLGAISEITVDGSVSISLLALVGRSWAMDNTSDQTLGVVRFFNRTMPQRLQFLITYKYIPSCPELICRDLNGFPGSCAASNMAGISLEANLALAADNGAQICNLRIPPNEAMRSALAKRGQPASWMARIEFKNFIVSCPCHNCEADEQQEAIAISRMTTDFATEETVVCGNYANKSKVVYMPIAQGGQQLQVTFSSAQLIQAAAVRVTFVNCLDNSRQRECEMAQLRAQLGVQPQPQGDMAAASHGGLIVVAVLLAAAVIGSLLLLNRASLLSGGSRIQESLRSRRSHGEDSLQLTPEPADAE